MEQVQVKVHSTQKTATLWFPKANPEEWKYWLGIVEESVRKTPRIVPSNEEKEIEAVITIAPAKKITVCDGHPFALTILHTSLLCICLNQEGMPIPKNIENKMVVSFSKIDVPEGHIVKILGEPLKEPGEEEGEEEENF